MEIKFQVQIKIQKPVAEVFDAVYDPTKLSGYFTNGGASAPLDEGTTVQWTFADTPGEEISFPVKVESMVKNEHIELAWASRSDGKDTTVRMEFDADGPNATVVNISESGWEDLDAELKRSYSNCMGWSQMLSALKAYVEYGINLRKGAYEGMYKASDKGAKTGGD